MSSEKGGNNGNRRGDGGGDRSGGSKPQNNNGNSSNRGGASNNSGGRDNNNQAKGSNNARPTKILTNNSTNSNSSNTQSTSSTNATASSSTPAATGVKRNVTDILKNAFTSSSSASSATGTTNAPTSTSSSSDTGVKIHSRELELYGVIISIRGSFGFLQAIFEEEQYYFSDREFYDNMKVGDRVAFIPRTSPKGPSAQNVRFLIPTFSKLTGTFTGVVTRSPERHRSGCGLIEVDIATLASQPDVKQLLETKFKKCIPYRPIDIVTSTLPKNHFLDKGDAVEFTISKTHDCSLYLATDVKLKQLKRDRVIAMQIQRMLEAGAVREVGVVTTLKNKEYGFIRAQDRKDELYFRMDDIADEDIEIEEGMEVDFFVIAEVIKGKVCDRAIHLKKVPKGTVQFEVIVSTETLVTVEDEPGLGANETPGIASLSTPLDVSAASNTLEKPTIDTVDIWQRCLPDDMVCKRGDVLSINVHYYRPEKLFFARSVKIHEYLPYGRDRGVVIATKEQAFGFINSLSRKVDLYFRTTQVMNENGSSMLDISEVQVGMILSYDIVLEDNRLRAARVKVETADIPLTLLVNVEDGVKQHPYCISSNVIGVVIRSTTKKDSIGLIEVEGETWKSIYETDFIDPLCVKEVQSFLCNHRVTSFDLLALNASLLKSYMDILLKYKTYLKVDLGTIPQMDQYRNLRVTKTTELLNLGKTIALSSLETQDVSLIRTDLAKPKDGYCVPYLRDDVKTSEQYPNMIGNDLEVIFDVYWDRGRGKRMAKNIRLTDEVIPEETSRKFGVVDVVIDKGEKFGFIRVIENEEKLLWFSSSSQNKGNMEVGTYVSFQIRRRGGMRVACDIEIIPQAKITAEIEIREELCKAVVVSPTHVVLIDTLACPPIRSLYVHPPVINEVIVPAAKESKSWEKVNKGANGNGAGDTSVPENGNNGDSPLVDGEDSNGLALTKEDSAAATGSNRREYKAKHYSSTHRALIPIKTDVSGNHVKVEVGDVVTCKVALSYKQRNPVFVDIVEVLAEKASKKKGTVNRVKFRLKNIPKASTLVPADQYVRYNLSNTDFIEILDVEAMTKSETTLNRSEVYFFYCDVHEIPQPLNEYSRDILAQSDEIEFWHVPSAGYVALAPSVVPKARLKGEEGLKFHGLGFNEQLKEMKSKIGVTNNIVMAKGPPTDTAQGFEAGWRQVDPAFITTLPWASMLTHLAK